MFSSNDDLHTITYHGSDSPIAQMITSLHQVTYGGAISWENIKQTTITCSIMFVECYEATIQAFSIKIMYQGYILFCLLTYKNYRDNANRILKCNFFSFIENVACCSFFIFVI